uniref:Putative DNA ligase domain protein n=1 Tax=viral metagenome TaxID=1070528 RepID=A0A6H1ZCM5_9ZZZZ
MPPKFQRWKGVMKCYPFEEKRLAKWAPPFIVQPKYDGVRCRAIPLDNGDFLLLSSEENPIFSVPHINRVMKEILPPWEFDGELYCHGMEFEEILSITSRTVNLHHNHEAIGFYCFDIVNDQSQHSRLALLISLQNEFRRSSYLITSPFYICNTLDEIMRAYDKILESGYEGIIVRHCQAPYEVKRSIWVMKFKPKKEDTYEIVGSIEEMSITGQPKNSLGALICNSGDGNTFNVGTGFSANQRTGYWRVREELIGRKVRVAYQHLTLGKKVPRFPVFMEVIEDGSM